MEYGEALVIVYHLAEFGKKKEEEIPTGQYWALEGDKGWPQKEVVEEAFRMVKEQVDAIVAKGHTQARRRPRVSGKARK